MLDKWNFLALYAPLRTSRLLCAKNKCETNWFPAIIQECQGLEWQLVLWEHQLSYKSVHCRIDGWFCENQPCSNLRILKLMGGMTVGFTKTTRVPTLVQQYRRLKWRLVFQKPATFQPSYINVYGWNDDWFTENQPFGNPHIEASRVGLMVGFAKTNPVPTIV